MKAITVHQYGGPEVLQWEEAPDPKPAAGQVVVRVRATGVNPVDTYRRAGQCRSETAATLHAWLGREWYDRLRGCRGNGPKGWRSCVHERNREWVL